MSTRTLTVAVIHEVFFDATGESRLRELLIAAGNRGAELAVLPELPLNPWSPATKTPLDEDAEPPRGARFSLLARLAGEVGIAMLGGVIERDPGSGKRHNTALLLDRRGDLLGTYRKAHLPEEEGFWETSHYEPADDPPMVIHGLPMPVGVQICSDLNRPNGCQLLGAMGAELILGPRATPEETYQRWRLVLRANAVTSTCYLISVNRPRPEQEVPIGCPSLVISPSGEVLVETTEPLTIVTLSREAIEQARRAYPGYLPYRANLYARGWQQAD
jgi:predicted amidohydrolase